MRVAGSGDVLGSSSVLHREHSLTDHLASVGADDPRTEHLVGLLAGENLYHTLRLIVAASSAIGGEREHTFVVLNALFLELLLGQADVGDFRESVDHAWNAVVVDVAALAE